MKHNNTLIRKVFILCLVLVLAVPATTVAAEAEQAVPYASHYLNSYSAYVHVTSSGEVQVWYDVMGVGDMDEIGALSIVLYESSDGTNWGKVKTFRHSTTAGMLEYNDYYISSHVSWQGSASKQYKAYVCVWAGKDGDGDSRYFWAY